MNITPSNLGGDHSREITSALSGPVDEQKEREQNGFGVPADMTPSSNKTADAEPFVDEEEEEVETNNIVTQAHLFKSYSDQNCLYVNQFNQVFWFEYGGRKIGTLNLSIIDVNQMKLKLNHQ